VKTRGGQTSRSWITCPNCGRRAGRFEYQFADPNAVRLSMEQGEPLPTQVLTIVELAPGVTAHPAGELFCPRGHRVWRHLPDRLRWGIADSSDMA
jgi:hypothetical protein